MASSENFKQALKAGNLTAAFVEAISQAPEFQVRTWIADSESNDHQDLPKSGKYLRTQINLVAGEIVNEIGEEVMQDNLYPAIQQFHWQQATQGHQTIQHNLASLQKMFRLMASFQQRQLSDSDTQGSWLETETKQAENSVAGNLTTAEPIAAISSYGNSHDLNTTEEDDAVVDDLMSLADLDVDGEPEVSENEHEDWGDWIEEEENPMTSKLKNLKTDFLRFNSTVDSQGHGAEESHPNQSQQNNNTEYYQ